MTPRVSVLLPSRHPELAARALHNLDATTRGSYEVVVVADFELPGFPAARWTAPEGAVGPIATQTRAFSQAAGEFVLATADDALLEPGWDDAVVAEFEAVEREHPVEVFLLGLRFDVIGTTFGIYYANFPFTRRVMGEKLKWYDPRFKLGFGDCDMSLRTWQGGGYCGFTRKKLLTVTKEDQRKGATVSLPEDLARFVERWAPIYGAGWDTSTIETFNVNLDLTSAEIALGSFSCQHAETFFGAARGWTPILLQERPDGLNVVGYAGKRYLIPQTLGAVNLADPRMRRLLQTA